MENRRNGIFLGVVAIATLIVAIIGATFAYFSASAGSTNNAVELSAYEFDVQIDSIEKLTPTTSPSGIIPLNPGTSSTTLLHAVNNGGTGGKGICIDDKGYVVCQLYKVTLTNGSANPSTLKVRINTVSNTAGTATGATAFTDLTAQALTYSPSTYALLGDAVALATTENGGFTFGDDVTATVTAAENPARGTGEFYFVVYLNEASAETDQSSQMGAHYVGEIEFMTGGNRLTGTFNF